MRVAIDRAGRVVVPAQLRRQLGLRPGVQLEATVDRGALIVTPLREQAKLVEEDGRLVAVALDTEATLTQGELLDLVDEVRGWPRRS
jgi:AbrB family looped-hinge helix DNA binding protein